MAELVNLNTANALESLDDLVSLLRDAVESGAAVGFLPPLSDKDARLHWRRLIERLPTGLTVLLGAREDGHLVGCVHLELENRPNGKHRAEVIMLLVGLGYRRRGIGRSLMRALDKEAQRRGRTLLVVEIRKGDPAEALCRQMHFQEAGIVPRYARSASGALQDFVFLYRELD
jgi:ribosomal protein S18 acetylase RimI-like enzyme